MLVITLIFILLIASIIFDAYADGLIDTTHKRAHVAEAFGVLYLLLYGVLMTFTSCVPWYDFLIFYLFARIAFFNPVYNLTRKLPLTYTGTTDGVFDRWFRKAAPSFMLFVHVIFGISAILLMLNRIFNC